MLYRSKPNGKQRTEQNHNHLTHTKIQQHTVRNFTLHHPVFINLLKKRPDKRSSYSVSKEFLEKPSYKLHDVYRALDILGTECDFIQAELCKNSHFMGERNDKVLYYDCSNYYFEIEQEDWRKSRKKQRTQTKFDLFQMELFMDGDGIPLAFSLFQENANEQTSLLNTPFIKKRYETGS